MLIIKCRLNELLGKREINPEDLAVTAGLPIDRILAYCDEEIDTVSIKEIGAIMQALGSEDLSDLFEAKMVVEGQQEETLIYEDDWHSPCLASADGKHIWYRDVTASSSVYQEYFCSECKHRFAFIL